MQQSLQCNLYENLCCLYLDINDCMPNPCENGGSCTDGVNEYFCTCILDTLEQTVKQVNCCKLYCKNMHVLPYVNDCIFQILNTENSLSVDITMQQSLQCNLYENLCCLYLDIT